MEPHTLVAHDSSCDHCIVMISKAVGAPGQIAAMIEEERYPVEK